MRRAAPPVWPTLLPGFPGHQLPDWVRRRLRAGLGGVCLFASNISSFGQLRGLTDAIYAENPHALVAVDEEGGDVTRLYATVGSPGPGNAVLGRLDDLALTRTTAAQIGWALRRTGCNVDFAPSVDINSCANNPVIGVRSFGATPERVARHGAEFVAGLQSAGVAATAKHFPGHGDTAQDSHLSLPVVDRDLEGLRRRELVPFAASIAAGARLVMTSHLLVPQLDPAHPATLSRLVLTDLLRGELGFAGVVVSDALDMAGARVPGGLGAASVRALDAGCDLLCLGTATTDADLDAIEQAVHRAIATADLDARRVEDAPGRVRALADDLAVARAAAPEPADPAPLDLVSDPLWPGDAVDLIRAFDLAPGVRVPMGSAYLVVRLEARPNSAAGHTPWGPFAAVAADPTGVGHARFAAQPQVVVGPDQIHLPPPVRRQPVLVVGRDIHRHAFAREVVDRLRAEHDDVLVVDMGWPSPDRRYADLATFGSSRVVGVALLAYLARESAA